MVDGVIPAERKLDAPPEGSEGEIRWVEFDHRDDRRQRTTHKECQACGEPVPLEEEHVKARGYRANSIGRVVIRPVFCSRECWTAWAARST